MTDKRYLNIKLEGSHRDVAKELRALAEWVDLKDTRVPTISFDIDISYNVIQPKMKKASK